MKRIVIAACLTALLMLVSTGASSSKAPTHPDQNGPHNPSGDFVRGRLLVKFRSHILPDHARQIIAALGARDAEEIPGIGVHILELPYQANEKAFVQAFENRREVEFAELDQLLAPDEVMPNDPHYATSEAWELGKIEAPSAWSITTGSSSITIAILDTGVDATHEDLVAKMVPGWNVINNSSDTRDVHGHGTKVAGTAAASSNNGIGIASIAWGCKLMPIRVADSTGYATFSAIASGLNWAGDHGARVANISFYVSESSTVTTAARNFQAKGGIVTSAAGNSGALNSAADNAYMLTVSATDQTDAPSFFSNYGNNIDLGAPEAAFTTTNGGGYAYAGGTSFSAPIVAGVAALVLSINPGLSATQVQDILKQSANDLGSAGWDPRYGWGRVNAGRATNMAAGNPPPIGDTISPTVSFSSPAQNATVSGVMVVEVSATDDTGVVSVSLTVGEVLVATDLSAPFAFSVDTKTQSNGASTLVATAKDAAGNTSSVSRSVMVNNVSDSVAPTISITSPSTGAAVSANVSITVNAVDNKSVLKVELYVDGKLSASSMTSPFAMKVNARKWTPGAHTLVAKAYDSVGNIGVAPPVTVYR
ncbi:MAG TPA: S8 family serine peptidase [Pyrinomonadaceae bacterium]|nr:S8 family serine peptidase [Pyrinomonadaceae bacterium]